MKLFSGFPSGKVQVTPLPNLFFSELLPAIDDLRELKVTLHVLWLMAHSKSVYIRASDLRADRVLMQSLDVIDAKPEQALSRALELATQRGTLLRLDVPGDGTGDNLYFLNTERGRLDFEKMQIAELPRGVSREPANVEERPNIFVLYEKSLGLLLTQSNAEELKELESEFTAEWVADALKETALQGKKSLKYTRSILERWKSEGRTEKSKSKSWYGDKYGKFVKR